MHPREQSGLRLTLSGALQGHLVLVRQLLVSDAEALASAAAEVEAVRGPVPVPVTVEDARAVVAHWDSLRMADQGTLIGIFARDTLTLVGVFFLKLTEDLVAEVGVWNRPDKASRKATSDGINVITEYAHRQMNIRRLWVELDPLDNFTRYLGVKGGYTLEGESVQPDGTIRHRYSSIG